MWTVEGGPCGICSPLKQRQLGVCQVTAVRRARICLNRACRSFAWLYSGFLIFTHDGGSHEIREPRVRASISVERGDSRLCGYAPV